MTTLAAAGIPKYRIANLPERVVEVHREPVPDGDPPFKLLYGTVLRLTDKRIAPLAAPDRDIPAARLLP